MPLLPDLPQTEAAIVELTNAFRKQNKLSEVRPNPALAAAARAFADYLARTGKFAHEADGRHPQDRAAAQGYRYCLIAENLALNLDSRGFESAGLASQVVEGWKASAGHRKNMLEPNVTEVGIGVARAPDKDPKFITVELLGRPEALRYSFKVRNDTGAPVRYLHGSKTESLPARAVATHTVCVPSALAFEAARQPGPRFVPRDGEIYTLRSGADGALRVEVTASRR
jgi:hypothetical protein